MNYMNDYVDKRVDECSNLGDFILKLKQGKMVKLANKKDDYYFTLPISDNIKILYRKHSYYIYGSFTIDKLGENFCGLLDCENNKLLLEKHECDYMIGNSSQSEITHLDTVMKQVDELLCRYQSDKYCELLEDKSLVKKDLSLNYREEYSDIQKLAMGINNFLYISLKRLREDPYNSEKQTELMSCVMGYLEEGLDYLKNVVNTYIAHLYSSKGSRYIHPIEEIDQKYSKLYKQYTNIKDNIDKFVKQEILKVLEDKSSVWINDNKFNDFSITESTIWMYGNRTTSYNRIEIPYQDINTIKYKDKEIFNRGKVIERLSSSEYQAGIDSLIEFVSNNFDRYNSESLNLKNVNAGNLIYSKNGHFGVVIAKDKIYLDNGVQADINDINICFKDEELDEGLKQMKKFISREYNNELQKVIVKNQKEQEEKEVETEVER